MRSLVLFCLISLCAVFPSMCHGTVETFDENRCEKGDGKACYRVSIRLAFILTGGANEIAEYLLKSCSKGYLTACYKGLQNQSGLEKECEKKDVYACLAAQGKASKKKAGEFKKSALSLLDEGCSKGDQFQCLLNLVAEENPGSFSKLMPKLESICKAGEFSACIAAGDVLMNHGETEKGLEYYKMYCDKGEFHSCAKIAVVDDKAGKTKESLNVVSSACKKGVWKACGLAGYFSEKLSDKAGAKSFYSLGCDNGDRNSCGDLALLLQEQGDLAGAKELLKPMCSKDKSFYCNKLGLLEKELGNYKEAVADFSIACKNDYAPSCLGLALDEMAKKRSNLSMMHFKKAREIFNRECDSGNNDSCDALKTLTKMGITK